MILVLLVIENCINAQREVMVLGHGFVPSEQIDC